MISELGDYSETFAQYADVASNIAHVQNVGYLSIARQFVYNKSTVLILLGPA
jgi:hypothetical protein